MQATLGRTGLTVNKDGFGALPVQRVPLPQAVALLQAAAGAGLDFFDTARMYTDSEEKLGAAFGGRWGALGLTLATKTAAATAADFEKDLATSLALLKTDCIDIYQFHNPAFCPLPGDGTGLYECMQAAKAAGKIRFIGLTNHRPAVARQAVESGLYDTLQYPLNHLSTEAELALVPLCEQHNVGFIGMKALSGGLITDVGASRAWLAQFPGVVPIWGIQHRWELDALLAAQAAGDELTDAHRAQIETDRAQLMGEFCRGCGYCLPCPAEIPINMCARMSLLLRRAVSEEYLTEEWQHHMDKIDNCIECGQCRQKCPYSLDTPALLKRNLADYRTVLAEGLKA